MKFAFGAQSAAVLFALFVGSLSAAPALATPPTAYCPPDASHFNACATVETELTLAGSTEATPAPYVYTSGYRSAGDGGGNVLYAQNGTFSGGFARFVLSPTGPDTRLVFDHTSFPNDAAEHLSQGWHINYWDPMAKVFA